MLQTGEFYRCGKSGAVLMVVRPGDAILLTNHGPMERKVLDVLDETLELVDSDLSTLKSAAGRDTGGRCPMPCS